MQGRNRSVLLCTYVSVSGISHQLAAVSNPSESWLLSDELTALDIINTSSRHFVCWFLPFIVHLSYHEEQFRSRKGMRQVRREELESVGLEGTNMVTDSHTTKMMQKYIPSFFSLTSNFCSKEKLKSVDICPHG